MDLLASLICPCCRGSLGRDGGGLSVSCAACAWTAPAFDDVVLFTEAWAGGPDGARAAALERRLAPMDAVELDRVGPPDAYAAFHPWNEAVRGAAPVVERLLDVVPPGGLVLDLGDRSGWSGHALAARRPDVRVLSVGQGGVLGVRGHRTWLAGRAPVRANFLRLYFDLDGSMPIADGAVHLIVGHDVLHDRDPSSFLAECARVCPGPWVFPHVHLDHVETVHHRGGVLRSGAAWRAALSVGGRRGRIWPEDWLYAAAREGHAVDLDVDQPDARWPNALALSLPPHPWAPESAAGRASPLPVVVFASPLLSFDGVELRSDDGTLGDTEALLARHPPLRDTLRPGPLGLDERRVMAALDSPRTRDELARRSPELADLDDTLRALVAREAVALVSVTPALARLQHFHATREVLPRAETVGAMWERAVERHGERVALIWTDGSAFTYAECDALQRRLMTVLAASDGALALVSAPRPEAMLVLGAALRLGRPIHVLPAAWDDATLAAWVVREDLGLCLVDRPRAGLPSLRIDEEALVERALSAAPLEPPEIGEHDEAVVLPSSGTLGPPRGVVLSQRALVGSARSVVERCRWTASDTVAVAGELATMSGLRNRALAPMLAGCAVWLGDPAEGSATVVSALPAWYAAHGRRLGPCTRQILCHGAPLAGALREELQGRLRAEIVDIYGLTETAGAAIFLEDGRGRRCALDVAVGGRSAEPGEEGELRIASANAALRTTDAPLPVWLDTGDRAVWRRGGGVALRGREARTWVHPEGWKVPLDPVEARLIALGATDAAVCPVGASLGAAVVGPRVIAARLRAEVQAHVWPRRWVFLPSLPVNPAGKHDQGAIVRALVEGGEWLDL